MVARHVERLQGSTWLASALEQVRRFERQRGTLEIVAE
jgi:hypothetical protein